MTKELTQRIITSIILIAIVLNCLFINNLSWLFLLLIVSFISWIELITTPSMLYASMSLVSVWFSCSRYFLTVNYLIRLNLCINWAGRDALWRSYSAIERTFLYARSSAWISLKLIVEVMKVGYTNKDCIYNL